MGRCRSWQFAIKRQVTGALPTYTGFRSNDRSGRAAVIGSTGRESAAANRFILDKPHPPNGAHKAKQPVTLKAQQAVLY
ncbi:hypothetical protein ZRA01_22180 [Zoogloea ramigera]|uniref:Uncharacterized protein n=1 Tax=Zoogloea ramigera TaxID=350 RepID=A0A4Y4CT54_ZOORA|nr:hypothetical protein ZRA01_22180 [Zoogloea ramigera]